VRTVKAKGFCVVSVRGDPSKDEVLNDEASDDEFSEKTGTFTGNED
jgi:hypothetical protein